MKNITLSADARLIENTRKKAQKEHRSINELFREWMARYLGQDDALQDYENLMKKIKNIRPGKKFTRDELNER